MKNLKILRIFSIALILSLLVLAVPALPAMAAYDITISPTSGKVGATISISGTDFSPSTDASEKWARIIFAADIASVGQYIDLQVNTYKIVKEDLIGYEDDPDEGEFSTTFTVPSSLTDGTEDLASVTPGTYYIYVVIVTSTSVGTRIYAAEDFTVTANATLNPLSVTSGPAGTQVTVSGTNWPSGTISITFDGSPLTITGSTQTSGGSFASIITIPQSTAGTHTIYVTVGTTTLSTPFTVTASAALDPLTPTTGAAGTDVIVSGAHFPASTALVFKFDTTTLTPKSGDTATRSSGIFISTITVPSSATAGAHTITVTAGTGTATATFTVTATAALNPLSPASGLAGTDVTVSGANLLASYPIIFKLNGTTLTPKSGDVSTTIGGSFVSIVTIPAGTAAGEHTISVTVGTTVLTATFTVTGAPTPTQTPSQTAINVVQNDFNVGAPIGIGGAGFTPGATVTIEYAGETIATAEVEDNSTFSVIFEVPALELGARQFTISDGVNTTTANFVVETTAPSVPAALSPESGTKSNLPITFDWEDVTDASSPVTYDFQIATDEDFTTDSIVLEKKALAESKFMLTEAEGLDLAGEEGAYYWRAKAVDAALNESAWNNTSEFFTSGPSSFPKWAIYLIGIIGGLFLLIIGFWIGRRTAFYY